MVAVVVSGLAALEETAAITLGVGIITSVFTAIYVTRLIITVWFNWRKPAHIQV